MAVLVVESCRRTLKSTIAQPRPERVFSRRLGGAPCAGHPVHAADVGSQARLGRLGPAVLPESGAHAGGSRSFAREEGVGHAAQRGGALPGARQGHGRARHAGWAWVLVCGARSAWRSRDSLGAKPSWTNSCIVVLPRQFLVTSLDLARHKCLKFPTPTLILAYWEV